LSNCLDNKKFSCRYQVALSIGKNATRVSRASLGLIPTNCHVKLRIYKNISCCREAAQRSVSLKILLTQDRAKIHRRV